jgi:hypothetical protein
MKAIATMTRTPRKKNMTRRQAMVSKMIKESRINEFQRKYLFLRELRQFAYPSPTEQPAVVVSFGAGANAEAHSNSVTNDQSTADPTPLDSSSIDHFERDWAFSRTSIRSCYSQVVQEMRDAIPRAVSTRGG